MCAASAVSFIARDFHASVSMMIIASHNSGQYTEHRPYGFDSCMITAEAVASIVSKIGVLDFCDACGVPAIVFAYAENQMPQINALKKEGLVMYAGVFSDLERKK